MVMMMKVEKQSGPNIAGKSGKGECWSVILPTQPVLERLVALLTPHVLIWHVCLGPLHNSREARDDRRVTNMRWTVQQGSKQ